MVHEAFGAQPGTALTGPKAGKLNPDKDADAIDYDYSYTVDNQIILVRIPITQ